MVPNILHYIHLSDSGRNWKLHHHLSVKSAVERSGVDEIYFWMDKEPEGVYWDLTKPFVTTFKVDPPKQIFGIPITQPAHKSDVLRLQILLEYGGIYVDTDTIFVKSFEPLLDVNFSLGAQGKNGVEGLCPAVIISEKNAVFAQYWLAGFKTHFQGGPPGSLGWCIHSVNLPARLAHSMPDHITVQPYDFFFWPLYHQEHMEVLFEQDRKFPNAFSHHLWESSGKKYLDGLTPTGIKNKTTTFTRLVEDLL